MSTAVAPPDEDEALVFVHEVVEVPVSLTRRIVTGSIIVAVGLFAVLAFGIGARNGEAAFQISQFSDKYQVPIMRFPGGGAAMVLGALIILIGLGQIARGYTKAQMRWAISLTVLLSVLAFLCWAATGNPQLPISLTGLMQGTIAL